MISELKDDEILDFLMTSDFESDYSPSELKYLLIKWRYFYRVLHGQSENRINNLEYEIKSLKESVEQSKTDAIIYQNKIASKQNIIDSLKNRELSWKERFSGKIITNENEN